MLGTSNQSVPVAWPLIRVSPVVPGIFEPFTHEDFDNKKDVTGTKHVNDVPRSRQKAGFHSVLYFWYTTKKNTQTHTVLTTVLATLP